MKNQKCHLAGFLGGEGDLAGVLQLLGQVLRLLDKLAAQTANEKHKNTKEKTSNENTFFKFAASVSKKQKKQKQKNAKKQNKQKTSFEYHT